MESSDFLLLGEVVGGFQGLHGPMGTKASFRGLIGLGSSLQLPAGSPEITLKWKSFSRCGPSSYAGEQSWPRETQHRPEGLGGLPAVRGALSSAKGVHLFPIMDKEAEKAEILTGWPNGASQEGGSAHSCEPGFRSLSRTRTYRRLSLSPSSGSGSQDCGRQ